MRGFLRASLFSALLTTSLGRKYEVRPHPELGIPKQFEGEIIHFDSDKEIYVVEFSQIEPHVEELEPTMESEAEVVQDIMNSGEETDLVLDFSAPFCQLDPKYVYVGLNGIMTGEADKDIKGRGWIHIKDRTHLKYARLLAAATKDHEWEGSYIKELEPQCDEQAARFAMFNYIEVPKDDWKFEKGMTHRWDLDIWTLQNGEWYMTNVYYCYKRNQLIKDGDVFTTLLSGCAAHAVKQYKNGCYSGHEKSRRLIKPVGKQHAWGCHWKFQVKFEAKPRRRSHYTIAPSAAKILEDIRANL